MPEPQFLQVSVVISSVTVESKSFGRRVEPAHGGTLLRGQAGPASGGMAGRGVRRRVQRISNLGFGDLRIGSTPQKLGRDHRNLKGKSFCGRNNVLTKTKTGPLA